MRSHMIKQSVARVGLVLLTLAAALTLTGCGGGDGNLYVPGGVTPTGSSVGTTIPLAGSVPDNQGGGRYCQVSAANDVPKTDHFVITVHVPGPDTILVTAQSSDGTSTRETVAHIRAGTSALRFKVVANTTTTTSVTLTITGTVTGTCVLQNASI